MEQNIQNNAELNEMFQKLVNAVNTPFNLVIRQIYDDEDEEKMAFNSFIQPNCQPKYTGKYRYMD